MPYLEKIFQPLICLQIVLDNSFIPFEIKSIYQLCIIQNVMQFIHCLFVPIDIPNLVRELVSDVLLTKMLESIREDHQYCNLHWTIMVNYYGSQDVFYEIEKFLEKPHK